MTEMKQKIPILAVATLAMAFASCSNDDNNGMEAAKYITVNTSIGTLSRTATADDGTQTFADGDQISVYAWTGSANAVAADGLVVNNAVNTLSISGETKTWTANPQMLWKDMTTAHYFLGVYPQKAITDFTADAYALDATKSMEENDLLVAVNAGNSGAGFTATNASIPLQFDHVMAKLIVNLSFRNQWGETPTVTSVTATNAKTKATVNYLTKTVTATTDAATATALSATTANTVYQSIMVPQSGEGMTITIKIGDKDYTYTGTVKLDSGKYTIVNLNVGRDAITLADISINDWGTGTTINGGEAQEQ